jgi:hypothetical protein
VSFSRYIHINDDPDPHRCFQPPPPLVAGGHPRAGDIWECSCGKHWYYYWQKGQRRWWDIPIPTKGRARNKALGLQ